jgi:hypothetical protein
MPCATNPAIRRLDWTSMSYWMAASGIRCVSRKTLPTRFYAEAIVGTHPGGVLDSSRG